MLGKESNCLAPRRDSVVLGRQRAVVDGKYFLAITEVDQQLDSSQTFDLYQLNRDAHI